MVSRSAGVAQHYKERETPSESYYRTDGMSYFQPQERRTAQITCRVPKSVADGLSDLARFWTELEIERTGDKETAVNLSDVVVRLLQVGLDGAWGEFGARPQSEADFDKLLALAKKHLQAKK